MTGPVEPRLSRGLRDLLPAEMLARQRIVDTIRGVYELYGFVPLGTPAIEYLDVLRGSAAGAEAQQSIFTVQNP
ncbi:MAG TPA: ATP phosphoribosyltransferase regulatory subunit, partial [Thermoanaerobaculia bacterium]|nr:ATP phosphoribosyltransferase regulatory subunit [Thermoanaerobaculia bacterium]